MGLYAIFEGRTYFKQDFQILSAANINKIRTLSIACIELHKAAQKQNHSLTETKRPINQNTILICTF